MKKPQHSIIIKGGTGLNTNDEKIQWHPAFDAALQIEFGDETKYLEFDPEHLISKKPMQIDVLVKNEKHVKLKAIPGTRRCSHACKLGETEGGIEYV